MCIKPHITNSMLTKTLITETSKRGTQIHTAQKDWRIKGIHTANKYKRIKGTQNPHRSKTRLENQRYPESRQQQNKSVESKVHRIHTANRM
jgi:hypothetical protein